MTRLKVDFDEVISITWICAQIFHQFFCRTPVNTGSSLSLAQKLGHICIWRRAFKLRNWMVKNSLQCSFAFIHSRVSVMLKKSKRFGHSCVDNFSPVSVLLNESSDCFFLFHVLQPKKEECPLHYSILSVKEKCYESWGLPLTKFQYLCLRKIPCSSPRAIWRAMERRPKTTLGYTHPANAHPRSTRSGTCVVKN